LLCDSMASELKKCAWDVYGVPANKLRIFFHYHVSRATPLPAAHSAKLPGSECTRECAPSIEPPGYLL
jgi:hypothetical protein